ncbi:MAG: ThuA domain-containing protein [Bacillus sp. (in: Bacteria)]|nr:ThuA domain-containing protein [Bacillus sp. (in: firmicutes)]
MKHVTVLLGDYWHKAQPLKEGLENALAPVNSELKLNYINYDELIPQLKENPDLVIISKENRLNPQDDVIYTWMTPEIEEALSNYVKAGGSILAWHSGLAEYEPDGEYIAMLRGHFLYHPPGLQQVTYHFQGESFTIEDEQYFVQCQTGDTDVFLTSTSSEGESIAGWQHQHGNGRVCCFTPAHTLEGLLSENISKLLLEKIRWCVGLH